MQRHRFLRPWLERKGFSVTLCVLGGALGVLLIELAFAGWRRPLWSQEAAGWAQAVGTVAAIIFAWWQGRRELYLAERSKRDETLRFLGGLAHLAQSSMECGKRSDEALQASNLALFEQVAVDIRDKLRYFEKLSQLPVHMWPSPGMAVSADFCLEELQELSERYPRLRAALRCYSDIADEITDYHQRFLVFCWRCSSLLQQVDFHRAINERGPGPVILFGKRRKVTTSAESPPA